MAAAVKVATFWVKVLLVARSIVKPVWLLALFVQLRLIWVCRDGRGHQIAGSGGDGGSVVALAEAL